VLPAVKNFMLYLLNDANLPLGASGGVNAAKEESILR
jgi:hypothetical protein